MICSLILHSIKKIHVPTGSLCRRWRFARRGIKSWDTHHQKTLIFSGTLHLQNLCQCGSSFAARVCCPPLAMSPLLGFLFHKPSIGRSHMPFVRPGPKIFLSPSQRHLFHSFSICNELLSTVKRSRSPKGRDKSG